MNSKESMENYQKKQDELFGRWMARCKEENRGGDFTWDGVAYRHNIGEETDEINTLASWKKWEDAKPKILFLLKEAFGGYHPEWPDNAGRNFGLNMSRWKHAISAFYQQDFEYPVLPENNQDLFDGVAIMEVKKMDESKNSSNNNEIFQYAIDHRELLKEQIELINPEVIVCCGTFIVYEKGIYESLGFVHIAYEIEGKLDASIFRHNGRIVVYFYHPSYAMNKEDAYNLLCKLFVHLRNPATALESKVELGEEIK